MLCGTPASWLSKAIANGVSAGAVNAFSTNWMSLAATVTAAGGPDAGGARRTRRANRRAPRSPPEPRTRRADPPLTSPMAKADSWRTAAIAISATRLPNRSDGVLRRRRVLEMAGRVRSDDLAVLLDRVAEPADERRDQRDDARRSAASRRTRGRGTGRTSRTRPRNGRNDGPGMWTPGGGPVVDDRRQRRRRVDAEVVVEDAQRLGQPVEQRQRQRDRAEQQDPATEHEAEEQEERRPSPRRPARTTAPACGSRPASAA